MTATLDRDARRVDITVAGPTDEPPADAAAVLEQGVDCWPFAVARALDDLVLRLRTNEQELGTWVFRTAGDVDRVLAYDAQLGDLADDWFVARDHAVPQAHPQAARRHQPQPGRRDRAGQLLRRAPARAGAGLRPAVHARRASTRTSTPTPSPAVIVLTESNDGRFPMGNGLSRLESRFWGHDDAARRRPASSVGERLDARAADEAGLVTMALDDIDFEDEIRIVLEERASLSPDALTGMEANHRFVGPETMETKIFGRLTAWQNWIFIRPNASGPGRRAAALRRGPARQLRLPAGVRPR